MGRRENQKTMGDDHLSEASVACLLDSELEVVFSQAAGGSDGPELTQCHAQEAHFSAVPTAEGAQSNVQATVLDDQVLQSYEDVMDTFTWTEATESSAQEAMLELNEVQYAMPEAVSAALTAPEKSIVHLDVSEVSPSATSAAPVLLHEAVIDAYPSAEAVQYIVQKDELVAGALSGLEHELAADAVPAVLQENVLATKATHAVLQREWLDAESQHSVMLENELTFKEVEYNAHESKLPTQGLCTNLHKDAQDAEAGLIVCIDEFDAEVSRTTLDKDGLDAAEVETSLHEYNLDIEVYTTVQEDRLDAELPHSVVHKVGLCANDTHTSIQEDGLDAETKQTVQENMLDSETPYSTVQEDGLDAEVEHTTVHNCVLNAPETRTTLEESGLDVDVTNVGEQEDGLHAKATQASIENFPDFSLAAKAIHNVSAARKEQELLVQAISQKLGYINGHEVINHFAGCNETSEGEELSTDSYATKELDTLRSSLRLSDENSDLLHKSEPQPKIDSDSKMRKIAAVTPMPQYVIVKFRVHYITHSESQLIAVTGNHESLGEWNIYVPLKPDKDGFWSDFVLLPVDSSIEWKFVMVENGKIKRWEECANRYLKTGHDDTEAHQWWGYH